MLFREFIWFSLCCRLEFQLCLISRPQADTMRQKFIAVTQLTLSLGFIILITQSARENLFLLAITSNVSPLVRRHASVTVNERILWYTVYSRSDFNITWKIKKILTFENEYWFCWQHNIRAICALRGYIIYLLKYW